MFAVPFIDLEAEVESDDGDEDLQKAIVRSLAPQGKGKAPSAVEAGGKAESPIEVDSDDCVCWV